ncbi:hypothetical protein K7X08_004469 [Anisodus acutangulus]|uniref:Uncharacterized protein n=1 Tax=Anisodus acutangulus TaxID=402998 RepID=A0A9Q1MGV3_9SOLA|nr:hypothetical protein K7X08_004469 [Anisodus acutangulus]
MEKGVAEQEKGLPSGVQTGAGKGRTSGEIADGQPSGVHTGAGKGRTEFQKKEGKREGQALVGVSPSKGEEANTGGKPGGQPTGVHTEAGKGRTLGKAMDDQPSGSQTEVGKDGINEDASKGQIFAPQTVRSSSPAVKHPAIFSKLAAMQDNIVAQNEIDRKAKTSIEIAMAQSGRIEGNTTVGQPAGSQTGAGKGRTELVAQPVDPSVKVGEGGNYVQGGSTKADDGFTEVKKKGKPKSNPGSQSLSFPLSRMTTLPSKKKGLGSDPQSTTNAVDSTKGAPPLPLSR